MKLKKVNHKKYRGLKFLIILLGIVFLNISMSETAYGKTPAKETTTSSASEVVKDSSNNDSESNVGFTVEAVKPSSQIEQDKGFFYVKVAPEEEQELMLNIKSTRNEKVEVKIYIKDAYTSSNGTIDYDSKNYKRDSTLKNSLEDITSISEKKITVENFETKSVKIKVSPPKQKFDGVKVAAVCVMAFNSEEQSKEKSISSSFGYRIGLLVTEEDLEEYNDGKSLNLLKIKPSVSHGKRVIQATFQNPEAKVLDNLTVKAELKKKDYDQVLRSRETNSMRMAPNSQFDFGVNWGVDRITPGTYVLSIVARSNNEKWNWDEEFTIGEKEAKRINKEAVYTITYPKWLPIVIFFLGTLVILNICFLIIRRRAWNKEL